MQISWSIKIVVILAQAFLLATYLTVLASEKNVGEEQCIGKYQLDVDNVTSVDYSRMQIKFNGLDEIPTNSTIENDGRILKIELNYRTVPTMEVNLAALGVAGIFRLKFLYFQWFKTVPGYLVDENVSFPAQLHAVFYDENAKSFDEAAVLDKKIIVLAFSIQVGISEETLFRVLLDALKNVREPNRKTIIKNISLKYWKPFINPNNSQYYAYEGSFSEFSCQGTVIWIELKFTLVIRKQTVYEFNRLKSHTGGPLMSQISEFVKPEGTVYMSKEITVLATPGLIVGVLFVIFYSY